MDRRRALVTAAATTVVVGAATVALAATGGIALLGFGSAHRAHTAASPGSGGERAVVTRQRDVYDQFVVSMPAGPPAAAVAFNPAGGNGAVTPVTETPGSARLTGPTTSSTVHEPDEGHGPDETPPTTARASTTTTTTVIGATSTTTVPRCHHDDCDDGGGGDD